MAIYPKSNNQQGFTIVELMIALSILSVLLLISSVTLISIGRMYSKGVNEAVTQNATRNITNNLSSQLQLGGSKPVINPLLKPVICIGSERYTYRLGHMLTSTSTDHVLWHDTMKSTASCTDLNLSNPTPSDGVTVDGSGSEMVLQHMRLTDFEVIPGTGSSYAIKVGVAFGDDDLLCDSGTAVSPGDCASPTPSTRLVNHSGDIHCKGGKDTAYCASSLLKTTVIRRLSD